jgi:hypothetical protein
MSDAAADSLAAVAARLEMQVNELRRAGDHAALLAAANAAADEIERRVGDNANDAAARDALTRARRLTFNVAADCWPGWAEGAPADTPSLLSALALARRSVDLVAKLGLGRVQQGTGIWLVGAFELALGRYADAARDFDLAREHYVAANAPGLALLTEGYSALLRELAGADVPVSADDLERVCAKITAGGFENGAEWIQQLRTAQKVFAAS